MIENELKKVIKSKKDSILLKSTRAGVTTNMVMTCAELGLRLLVVVPRVKITFDTFSEAMKLAQKPIKGAVLAKNKDACLFLTKKSKWLKRKHKSPQIAWDNMKYYFKRRCEKCKYNNKKHYFDISPIKPVFKSDIKTDKCALATITNRFNEIDTLFVTYAKLNSMLYSDNVLIEKLNEFDVVMLDEISHLTDTPSLDVVLQQFSRHKGEVYNFIDELYKELDSLFEQDYRQGKRSPM